MNEVVTSYWNWSWPCHCCHQSLYLHVKVAEQVAWETYWDGELKAGTETAMKWDFIANSKYSENLSCSRFLIYCAPLETHKIYILYKF